MVCIGASVPGRVELLLSSIAPPCRVAANFDSSCVGGRRTTALRWFVVSRCLVIGEKK
jgi:hypothetical protein